MKKLDDLNNMLRKAHQGRYAVGSFSPRYTKLILPIIQAAIDTNSPIIIQLSEKEIYRHRVDIEGFAKEAFDVITRLEPKIPIALHLDHTKDTEIIKQAIGIGFTSVMIDASEHDLDTNVEITKKVTEYAHLHNVTVEAELGKIGTTDFVETDKDEELFTIPEEAKTFCELTGIDALAVSVGTAHGIYTVRKPRIDFDRIRQINELIDTPLVLHGGSGVPEEMIVKAVGMEGGGVSKINIATDLEQAMLKVLGKETHMTESELNSYSDDLLTQSRNAVYNLVKEKIEKYLLSHNKA